MRLRRARAVQARIRSESDFFAVAQVSGSTSERRHFPALRIQADEVRHNARCAYAGPERFRRESDLRVTSLRSHRFRVAPANGATSPLCGYRLMKSGTMRDAPTQGQSGSGENPI